MPDQYAYSQDFFDRWYRPETRTVDGRRDVKHDELVSAGEGHYGDPGPSGMCKLEVPAEPPQTKAKTARSP